MGSQVVCELCPTECALENYQVGGCRVRINRDGVLYSLVYGKPCSVAVDPIEKKPFFHFLPGTRAYSIATVGCVLGCKFCQNWQISQADPESEDHHEMPPEDVVRAAIFYGCSTITYTYTEPTVFYEYMYDTARIARHFGMRNTMHSCGYINEKPLRELSKYLDAADVDLKSFSDRFYGRICGGRLRPVLDALTVLRSEGVWLELTNLVIPSLNDDMTMIREMCKWIVGNLGAHIPLHFSRFFPHYKLKDLPPTPLETLWNARQEALGAGLQYVYIGNARSEAEHTRCPRCGRVIIERAGYEVLRIDLTGGKCPQCGTPVPGVWGKT